MTRDELAMVLTDKFDTTKVLAKEITKAIFDKMQEELVAGGTVDIAKFGKFEVKEIAARVGHNPQTGEKITIAAHKKLTFRASKPLKDALR